MKEANDALLFDRACAELEGDSAGNGENCIEWIRGQSTVTVQLASHSKYANRVEKYAEDYPDEVQIVGKNPDGSFVAHLPLKYVSIRRPAHREMTEDQKQELRDRLAKARKDKNN